jgi:hypothetical protein
MPTTTIADGRMMRVAPGGWRTGDDDVVRTAQSRSTMKTIASALIALAVLTGAAASANAFDTQSFYEQLDRSRQ